MTGLSISGGESMSSRTVLAEQGRGGSGPTMQWTTSRVARRPVLIRHKRPREGHTRGSQFKLNESHCWRLTTETRSLQVDSAVGCLS